MATPILIMTHYIFLSRDERYLLNVPEAEIEVVGSCTPVWCKNGEHVTPIAEEFFAKYKIKHCPEPEKQAVTFTDEGFFVRLSPVMPPYLLDISERGHENINLTHKNFILQDNQVVPVIHYLNMDDIEVLEKTLC